MDRDSGVNGHMKILRTTRDLALLAVGFAACTRAQLVLPTLIPDATQGSYYYQTLAPSAGRTPYHSCLVLGSTLPQGLQFADTVYGPQISGVPQVFGQFSFTIEVSDGSSPAIRQARQYRLTIHESGSHPFVFLATTLPDATYGAVYEPQILVTGGSYPYTASYAGSGFGFTFDRNASLISLGQVSAFPGTYQLPVTVTDSSNPTQRISQTLTIIVKPGISLTSVLLTGTVFQPYADRIFVSGGGSAPYQFTLTSGALPPGMLFDGTTGGFSGTPSIPGTYAFQIGVRDSNGLTGSQDYLLEIYGLTLSMSPGSLSMGRMGVAYPATTLAVRGGVAPYVLTQVAGGLPPGMAFGPDWVLSGTPTEAGFYSFDFKATDQIGDAGQFVYPLTIQGIGPSTLPDGFVGVPYSIQLVTSGYSNALLLFPVSAAPLPPGITLVPVLAPSPYEANRFYLAGNPAQAGTFSVTLEARDAGGPPADYTLTLNVSRPRLSVSKFHAGAFRPGQAGATYTVTVRNVGGGATTGVVTMSEALPAGLTLVSMSGNGWNCTGTSCTREDALSSGSAYPPITVMVNVAPNAASPQVNAVSVSGGGSSPANTTDSTIIAPPHLYVLKFHNGNFTAGQDNAAYSVVIGNLGGAAAPIGMVTVTEMLPPGLTLVSMAGSGWTCLAGTPTCTRGDSMDTYPEITVTVNVAASAASQVINQVSVSGGGSVTATAVDIANIVRPPVALRFVPIAPCRIADTRNPAGSFGGLKIDGGSTRDFIIPDSACGVPPAVQAYSLNVAVVPVGPLGFLTLWPAGQTRPVASTLNSLDGRIKSNAAIIPAGTGGAVSVFASNATDVVLDINGYFVPASDPTALAYFPVTPCRIVDTRNPAAPLGGPSVVGGAVGRTFPILSSTCGIPATARAYSLNFAAVPGGPLGFVTAWPTGQAQPLASSLNAPTGTVTANAVIVPAGTGGSIDVFASNSTDMVIDVNGYFAPPVSGGLSLFAVTPCRVVDTRQPSGSPSVTSLDVGVSASGCGIPATAQAHVMSVTVVPPSALGFLTLFPQGQARPLVSTLNALDGSISSNMAIVPAANGSISVFPSNPTHIVMDISGYFAPF
jgi:uncharacterized repeat protein (TIGR01451 family)